MARDVRLPADTSQHELLEKVAELNEDHRVHGMIVQLPLPSHVDEHVVTEAIDPRKDVDGLHPMNVGRLVAGRPRFVPATPAGVQQMLLRSGYDPEGRSVVVCGRSEIVGKPLSILLMQRLEGSNATVTVCHTRTRDLCGGHAAGGHPGGRRRQPPLRDRRHGPRRRSRYRRWDKPRGCAPAQARVPSRGRRRLRRRLPEGRRHHAGAGRRRAHDHRHAAGQHPQGCRE